MGPNRLVFACATAIIFYTAIISIFLLVAPLTHPPSPLKVFKSPDKQNSILLHQLSYTTDTILPDLGTAEQARLRPSQKRTVSSADNILPHQGFTFPLATTIACADRESFWIETHPLSLIIGPYADSSELSYTSTLLQGNKIFVQQNNSCLDNYSGGTCKNNISLEKNRGCTSKNNSSVENYSSGTSKII